MAKRIMGCKFDPQDERDFMFQASRIKLPPIVNNKKFVTSIKNQGNEGSCVGFAAAKAVEVAFWKKTPKRKIAQPNLSERWAYEFAKENDEWPGSNYEGSSVRGALKALFKMGVCPESFWPYTPNRKGKAKAGADKEALKFKVTTYTRIIGIQNIKAALVKTGVVTASAMVHKGWWSPTKSNGLIKFNARWPQEGGHAFVICGYTGQGFIIANSWGTGWGKKGFAILTYKDAKLNLMDTWTISI